METNSQEDKKEKSAFDKIKAFFTYKKNQAPKTNASITFNSFSSVN